YLIQSAIDGYNVCIFAYGQTGSGKTFTIHGGDSNPGLTPRAMQELFERLRKEAGRMSYKLQVYMLELYQDTLQDLLLPKNAVKRKLEVKKDAKGMVVVENATLIEVEYLSQLEAVVEGGMERRAVAGTQMNAESSRSHLVLSIVIETTDLQTQNVCRGKLSLVDLAGSERVKKSRSEGEQLREAQSINKSLSALGDVISALAQGGGHIPYRNHKLTMLMSDSLGGNAKTLMRCDCVKILILSPSNPSLSFLCPLSPPSTLFPLSSFAPPPPSPPSPPNSYATRVRSIVNEASKNVSNKHVRWLKERISHWKQLAGAKAEEEDLDEVTDTMAPVKRELCKGGGPSTE
ncbi:unnamed protein product, partial [Closterium sp. NIES-64]